VGRAVSPLERFRARQAARDAERARAREAPATTHAVTPGSARDALGTLLEAARKSPKLRGMSHAERFRAYWQRRAIELGVGQ